MSSVELFYREQGLPSRPALVLMHGLFGASSNWGGVVRRLGDRFRIVVPDLRNHGQSPHADLNDYPAMALDVLALMDRLDLPSATLIGHSMGGKLAMHIALTEPERVESLAVVDMSPVAYQHNFDDVLRAFDAVDLDAIGNRRDAEAMMSAQVSVAGVRAFLLQNLVKDDGRWQWRLNLPALGRSQREILSFPRFSSQKAYPGAASFIYGAQSDYVLPRYRPEIRRLFLQATLCPVADAGHWVYADQLEGFMACLEGVLPEG